MPGKLVLVPTFDGRAVPTDRVRASYIDSAGNEAGFAEENGKLIATVKPGVYGIRCEYLGTPPQVRRLDKVESGSRGSKADPGPLCRRRKTAGEGHCRRKPHAAGDQVRVYKAGAGFDGDAWVTDLEQVAQAVYERELRYDTYDLKITRLGAGYPDEEILNVGSSEERLQRGLSRSVQQASCK